MRFSYNGKTYRIWFKHFNKPNHVRRTECSILEETGPKELYELISDDAICADEDQFCRATGRKLSLGRALIRLTKDRAFRHTAWMAYLNRGHEPAKQYRTQLVVTGE